MKKKIAKKKWIDPDRTKYERGWSSGFPETPCGFGSKMSETVIQRDWIPKMVVKHKIKSIADLGAGDLNWIQRMGLPPNCKYKPYDLVPRHSSVVQFDMLNDRIPQAHCLMVLWVLNHMPEKMAKFALNKLLKAKARYLMMTYNPVMWDFTDLEYVDNVIIRTRGDVEYEIRLIDTKNK